MRTCLVSLLAGVASAALLASAATAADLPVRTAPAPVMAAPIFTWTGFYAGVNAGWGWRDSNRDTIVLDGTALVPGTLFFDDNNNGGFTGGGQIGYNYQMGSFVIGLETDIQWADTNRNRDVRFVPAGGVVGTFVPGEFRDNLSDWFGTLRVRAGVAFDRVLIYATGGLAYSDNDTGWTAGGGVEWALPVNWFGSSAVTFGLEGLWLSFDNNNDHRDGFVGTFRPVGGTPVSVFATDFDNHNNNNDFFVARAKLNFKFGTY